MIMQRNLLSLGLVSTFLVFCGGSAFAEEETFDVVVSSVLTITPPEATVSIGHDGTDANQAFAAQSWAVASNDPDGATATFSSGVFQHTSAAAYKADCQLQLAVGSSEASAAWDVAVASDQTDYANGVPVTSASVVAASIGAGNASLDLTVVFVQSDYSILAAGTYQATVTGTILAN